MVILLLPDESRHSIDLDAAGSCRKTLGGLQHARILDAARGLPGHRNL